MTALDISDEYDDPEFLELLARLDLQDRSPATPPSRTPAHSPVPATRPARTPSATARLPQTPSSDPPAYTLSASHAVPLAHSQTITNTSPTASSTYYYESPTRRGCTTQWYSFFFRPPQTVLIIT